MQTFFRRIASLMSALAVVLVQVPVTTLPVAEAATSVLSDGFGVGATLNDIPDWDEAGANDNGANTAAETPGSGDDSASPNGGRFASIHQGEWICREINAAGFNTLQLAYYWRGDSDADGADTGIVEYKAGAGSCEDTGWTNLQTHILTTNSWTLQSAFALPGALDNTTFRLRFRNTSNRGIEKLRIDGVGVTGETVTTGSITIVKSAVPQDGTDFTFTLRNPQGTVIQTPTLDDANPDDLDNFSSSVTYADLETGNYTVNEGALPQGWILDNIICTGGDVIGNPDTDNRQVTVTVAAGANVVCTFYNSAELNGSITIVKSANPADGTDFNFSGSATFVLDDAAQDDQDGVANSYNITNLSANDYLFTENVPQGWTLDHIDCGQASVTTVTNGVVVHLAANGQVTCTFYNVQNQQGGNGAISIVKVADPESEQLFHFNNVADQSGFDLKDNGDASSDTYLETGLVPGSYTFSEDALAGWTLDNIICNSENVNIDLENRSVTIDIIDDESVQCEFYNIQNQDDLPGTLIVRKEVQNNDGGTKVPSDFTMAVDIYGNPPQITFPGSELGTEVSVPAGSLYYANEYNDVAYSMVRSSECWGWDPNYPMQSGETRTCTIINKDMPLYQYEGPVVCEDLAQQSGWFGEYYNLPFSHADIYEIGDDLSGDNPAGRGDPLSANAPWAADWYDSQYLRFDRVEDDIYFGENFYPFYAAEEEESGRWGFGVHWKGKVDSDFQNIIPFSGFSANDVWVYADGVLIASNVGVHPYSNFGGNIDVTAGPVVVDIFFAQRLPSESAFAFQFNSDGVEVMPVYDDCQPSQLQCVEDAYGVYAFDHSLTGGTPLATGLTLNPGDHLVINTDPTNTWSAGADDRTSNADGLTATNPYGGDYGLYLDPGSGQSFPYGALVGKIGSGDYFLVGTSYDDFVVDSGELQLLYWDSNNGDNSDFVTPYISVNCDNGGDGDGDAYDWGDAPEDALVKTVTSYNYPTTAANGGAHHIPSGLYMGANVDTELDGQPSIDADGDDTAGSDDEDGVDWSSTTLVPGADTWVNVMITTPGSEGTYGYMNAWIDFNHDGDWDDEGEHIIDDASVDGPSGVRTYVFSVPSDAQIGDTYARFRLSSISGLSYGDFSMLTAQQLALPPCFPINLSYVKGAVVYAGCVPDGEVEDYKVTFVQDDGALLIEKTATTDIGDDTTAVEGEIVTYSIVVTNTYETPQSFFVDDVFSLPTNGGAITVNPTANFLFNCEGSMPGAGSWPTFFITDLPAGGCTVTITYTATATSGGDPAIGFNQSSNITNVATIYQNEDRVIDDSAVVTLLGPTSGPSTSGSTGGGGGSSICSNEANRPDLTEITPNKLQVMAELNDISFVATPNADSSSAYIKVNGTPVPHTVETLGDGSYKFHADVSSLNLSGNVLIELYVKGKVGNCKRNAVYNVTVDPNTTPNPGENFFEGPDGLLFSDETELTRGRVAFIIGTILGLDFDCTLPSDLYSDVPTDHQYIGAICAAWKANFMWGYNLGVPLALFRPNNQITKAELIKTLYKATHKRYQPGLPLLCTDVSAGSWQVLPMKSAVADGIITVNPDGTCEPDKIMTAGDFSQMVQLFFGFTPESAGVTVGG